MDFPVESFNLRPAEKRSSDDREIPESTAKKRICDSQRWSPESKSLTRVKYSPDRLGEFEFPLEAALRTDWKSNNKSKKQSEKGRDDKEEQLPSVSKNTGVRLTVRPRLLWSWQEGGIAD